MSGGRILRINLKSSRYLVFFLISLPPTRSSQAFYPEQPLVPDPEGRSQWFVQPSRPCTRWLGGGSWKLSPPACPFRLLPGAAFMAGIWKLFLFTQHRQDAAARCAPANGNLGFPAGSFQRLHAKQPAVLQGASGPCYITVEEALPSVQTGHPGLSACPLDGQLPSYLESECFCYCCFIF